MQTMVLWKNTKLVLYLICFMYTGEEALDVIQIAHKYQMMNVVRICQKVLDAWILHCIDDDADSLLSIITVANRIEINDLLRTAIKMLAKHNPNNYTLFQGNQGNKRYTSLPLQVKHDILLERLTLVDDKRNIAPVSGVKKKKKKKILTFSKVPKMQ